MTTDNLVEPEANRPRQIYTSTNSFTNEYRREIKVHPYRRPRTITNDNRQRLQTITCDHRLYQTITDDTERRQTITNEHRPLQTMTEEYRRPHF